MTRWSNYTLTGSKARAIKTVIDGQTFHSKSEARRYAELRMLEAAGEISELETQVRFVLKVNDQKITTYTCDFRYRPRGSKRLTVEEHKGTWERYAKITWKLMQALHPEFDYLVSQ